MDWGCQERDHEAGRVQGPTFGQRRDAGAWKINGIIFLLCCPVNLF